MRTELKQDAQRMLRPAYIWFGVLALPWLGVAVYSLLGRDEKMTLACGVALFLMFALLLRARCRIRRRAAIQWHVTEIGLERSEPSGEVKEIPWSDIKSINRSSGCFGFEWADHFQVQGRKLARVVSEKLYLPEDGDAVAVLDRCLHNTDKPVGASSIIWSLILVVIGLVVTGLATVSVAKNCRSYAWQPVQATIITSDYQAPSATRTKTRMAELDLVYRYQVGDEAHSSKRYSLWAVSYRENPTRVQEFASQHPVGAQLLVYVNPRNSAEAVIRRGPNWLLGAPLLLLGPAIIRLGVHLRSAKPRTGM